MRGVEEVFCDLIGLPFVDGGRGPDGYDCWGLVREVYHRMGIDLQDYKMSCYDTAGFAGHVEEERPKWKRYEPKDAPVPSVVAIRLSSPNISHVGVYIGEGKFLHTREKTGVCIERIDSPVWRHRIEGMYTNADADYVCKTQ